VKYTYVLTSLVFSRSVYVIGLDIHLQQITTTLLLLDKRDMYGISHKYSYFNFVKLVYSILKIFQTKMKSLMR
jgi:hypothetical protein